MLYSYTLIWSETSDDTPYWLEELKEGDTRSCGPWEVCFPYQMTAQELNEYANREFCTPSVDGEEILHNYDGLEIATK